jgi:integrase/recombinase XerD
MPKEAVVVRIVEKVSRVCTGTVDLEAIREAVEDVLYDYDLTPAQRALVVQDDMADKILLYLASRKIDGLSERTLEGYQRYLGKFALVMRMNVEDITTMDIRRYLAYYAQTGVKKTTISTISNVLRGFFKWLEDEEYIIKSPVRKIKPIKIAKRLRKGLTHEELEILRDACNTYRQRALLEFFYATGCRLEEVENINKADIDWQRLKLAVIGKGDKERIVYLNAKAKIHLQKYLMTRLDDSEALFVTSKRPIKRLGRRSIERDFKKIEEQSKLGKSIYPHLIRHTMATHLLNSGADLGIVQAILGHEDASTTQIYAQLSTSNIEHEYRKHMIQ